MDKEILDMTVDELRIEVAMLRERCTQLEIRLEKAGQFPPRWLLERPSNHLIMPCTDQDNNLKGAKVNV